MANLLEPHEFRHWANFYWEKYQFKCVPLSGKSGLMLSKENLWDGDTISRPVDVPVAIRSTLDCDDWLARACDLAEEYRSNLTGIGVLLRDSGVIGLDFDNEEFGRHWLKTFKINCPLVKTGRGYHCYVSCGLSIPRTLRTQYYDILGWGHMVLPPSKYYRVHTPPRGNIKKMWEREAHTLDAYRWVRMIDIPKVNPLEIGLIPEWFLAERNQLIYNVSLEVPVKNL